ncbi:ABC transporter substrate-binding protein [Ramlibacter sp.]|uniref:ABC transporter substrate-binding protein n=1 Tax=Ramlibacter sp. TaxID=1917967 RepID=UPI00181B63A8|nr:ABC transporter substrate-binding protein [Ramlibacter sp.]MBA2673526.1 ABC transporter substrate-binding protein [Ramlibacter sp.]
MRKNIDTRMVGRRAAVAMLAGACLPASFAQTAGPSDKELVIGQSCQLTGPLAALSTEVRQGAGLYFDHVNASGGINGRKIRLVVLDDAYDPARAAENTRKLIDDEKVLALFQYAGTPPSMAALPLVEEHGVPFIAPFTGSDALRQKFSRYVFNVKAGYGTELDAMVRQLATVGIQKIAAVYLNNQFGTGGLAAVEKSVAARNVTLVARAPLEVDGSRMDAAVALVAKSSPQAIIVISAGKPSVDFVDAYTKAGHRSTFYMLSVISNAQLAKALGERARGIVVSQVVPSPWNRGVAISREFQTFAAAKGIADYTFSQMDGFVSAKLLVEGLRRAGARPTRDSLVAGLEAIKRVDLGGFIVELSREQHSSGTFVDLLMVGRDGRFTR